MLAEKPDTELVVMQGAAITPMSILQIAVGQGQDVDKLTKLMELQERFEANEARKAFNVAMAEFKKAPPQILKNHLVTYKPEGKPEVRYWHSTLDNVCEKVIPALSAVGISHKWTIAQGEFGIAVTCVLTHVLGHSEATTLRSSPDASGGKNPIQAIVSAVSYMERHSLLASVGMATEEMDDDAKKAYEQSGGLRDEVIAEQVNFIRDCRDLVELQRVSHAARKMAQEADDKKAELAFINASGERKKAINAGR